MTDHAWINDLRAADAVRLANVLTDLDQERLPDPDQLSTPQARAALATLAAALHKARQACRLHYDNPNDNNNSEAAP